jgi:hypothetical protein
MSFQLLRGTSGRFKCDFSWSCFGMTKGEAGTPGFLFAPLGMHSSHTFEETGVRSPLVYRFGKSSQYLQSESDLHRLPV